MLLLLPLSRDCVGLNDVLSVVVVVVIVVAASAVVSVTLPDSEGDERLGDVPEEGDLPKNWKSPRRSRTTAEDTRHEARGEGAKGEKK